MQTLVKNDEQGFIQDHGSQDYRSRRERLNTTQNAMKTRPGKFTQQAE